MLHHLTAQHSKKIWLLLSTSQQRSLWDMLDRYGTMKPASSSTYIQFLRIHEFILLNQELAGESIFSPAKMSCCQWAVDL